ncbi:hypothetical protein [Faecalimicrobium sp. JNUCC 81]
MENILEKINLYLEKLRKKLNNNKSFIYSFMIVFIVAGYGFFFNSNAFFKNGNTKEFDTSLEEIKEVGNYSVQVRDRKYSSVSNIIEFYVYAESVNGYGESKLQFELKEQRNPLEVIETHVRRLDENNYIIRAKVHKNWTVLSLGVGEFEEEFSLDDIENENKETQKTLLNVVKFYTEKDKVDTVLNLKEKKANEYLAEGIDIEIQMINSNITSEKKVIQEKNNTIETLEENIKKIKEEQVYQTEIEIKDSENKIENIKTSIKTLNDEIKNSEEKISEFENKISKLKEKKTDYLQK